MSYRCPNCQAVVERAHLCTRCGAPQSTRVLRGFTLAIASALAIALFGIATVVLQTTGVHRRHDMGVHSRIDHRHTVGDWSNYDDDEGPIPPRSNEPSIFTTLANSDAGVW